MSMITALGTSTPTSTTVVDTNSFVSPREKAFMTASFSWAFSFPWSTPTGVPGKDRRTRAAYSSTLSRPLSSSSMRGQMR